MADVLRAWGSWAPPEEFPIVPVLRSARMKGSPGRSKESLLPLGNPENLMRADRVGMRPAEARDIQMWYTAGERYETSGLQTRHRPHRPCDLEATGSDGR